ncbi:MAG: cytochrome c biogenesis protein [Deltaproteobacteria bacterium]|jgi:hypothetical protein|nr:cytochrome c biogenesis protein [Deltaproteobacteria bacterium]
MTQAALFNLSELAIFLSFLFSLFKKTGALSKLFLALYLPLSFGYVIVRYHRAVPMTPTFFGTLLSLPFLGLLGALALRKKKDGTNLALHRALVGFIFLLGLSQIFFPKDFYLPFLKTANFFSHCHLILAALGKAYFFLSGLWALDYLLKFDGGEERSPSGFLKFQVLGFCCWTLSIFSGEVWTYLGWGLPVVWEDPAVVTFLATWFFYLGAMHLRFWKGATHQLAAKASALGLIWLIAVNSIADFGPARFIL